jgi:mannose-1-phosphate guanylyltransferase
VRAIILVGGEGTRLRPLTETTPKQMLPVAELPMIERVVAGLVAHGITDVILSLGYRPDAFLAAFPDGCCAGARLSYVVEPELLDTAGAIRFAAANAGVDETFLVVNGDVLTDLDVGALIAFHRARGGEGTVALTAVEDPSSFGVVCCDGNGRVEAFIEKPAPGTSPSNLINAGFYVLEPSVLSRIPTVGRTNIERQTFPAMVADGSLYALTDPGYWLDVGTPERFLQASADLIDGTRRQCPVADAVQLSPGLWTVGSVQIEGEAGEASLIGTGARVESGAKVSSSVVGAGVTVGAGAVVTGSVLLPGAVVGTKAVVCRSIVGRGAVIGDQAVVTGWSLVGNGAVVDAGARLDGARHPA